MNQRLRLKTHKNQRNHSSNEYCDVKVFHNFVDWFFIYKASNESLLRIQNLINFIKEKKENSSLKDESGIEVNGSLIICNITYCNKEINDLVLSFLSLYCWYMLCREVNNSVSNKIHDLFLTKQELLSCPIEETSAYKVIQSIDKLVINYDGISLSIV